MNTKRWMMAGSAVVAVLLVVGALALAVTFTPLAMAQGALNGNYGPQMNNDTFGFGAMGQRNGMQRFDNSSRSGNQTMMSQHGQRGQGGGQGQGFVDENGDGVCDHAGQGGGQGQGFVDEDGDGVCDHAGQGGRQGQGRGQRGGGPGQSSQQRSNGGNAQTF